MLDFFNIINNPDYDVQYFQGTTGNTAASSLQDYQTWRKPRNATWVYMLCCGGGASGGTSLTGTAVGCFGGPGGDSAQQTTLFIPAIFLPDVLYVQCGMGAIPNTYSNSTSGSITMAGLASYVSIEPSTTQANNTTVIYAGGGLASLTAANTTSGGTYSTPANANFSYMTLGARGQAVFITNVAGNAGANLTSSASGLGAKPGSCLGSGVGGAGLTTAMAICISPAIVQSALGLGYDFIGGNAQSGAGANGTNGSIYPYFFTNYGGNGGSSANSSSGGGNGGSGGQGAPGCGGGGCGASTNAGATPTPGTGGPGFVLIISF